MTPRERFIHQQVEEAIAPYRQLLPPEVVASMGELLYDTLDLGPVASELVDEQYPREPPGESADLPKNDPDDPEATRLAEEEFRRGRG